jgi:hypothetical protein
MRKRSAEEWRVLVEAQIDSGESQERFCAEHGVGLKSFGRHKKQLGLVGESSPSSFVRIDTISKHVSSAATPHIVVRMKHCEWEIRELPLDGLVHLIRALA